jgi:hypothetical protein
MFNSCVGDVRAYNEAGLKLHGEFISLNLSILTKHTQTPFSLRFLRI